MAKPLVVFTHGGGRLGNQLFNVAHLWAWQEQMHPEARLCVLPFWPFAQLYSFPEADPGMVRGKASPFLRWAYGLYGRLSHPWNRRWMKTVGALLRVWGTMSGWLQMHLPHADRIVLELSDDGFNRQVRQAQTILLSGWLLRSWTLVEQQQQRLRTAIQPDAAFAASAASFVQAFRSKHDLVVGVQIRHGDYKTWQDGKYFFSTAEVAAQMRAIEAAYPDKRVGFLVTSDELQDESAFEGLNWCWSQGAAQRGGHFLLSILELGHCDLIVAPHSTFSAWAALYGDKPLFWMRRGDLSFTPASAMKLSALKDHWFI